MKRFRDKWLDNAPTWPAVRITIQIPPWHWHFIPSWYVDDVGGRAYEISWLAVELWVGWNSPKVFIWE